MKRVLDGSAYKGFVQDTVQGEESGEHLYLVKYTDGEAEHLTVDQVMKYAYSLAHWVQCKDRQEMNSPTALGIVTGSS